jgi:hypothetical protein
MEDLGGTQEFQIEHICQLMLLFMSLQEPLVG